jgi:hypothetical protein
VLREGITSGAFCAGAVTGNNDPTSYVLRMVTSPELPFRWRLGLHRLCVFSVGGLWLPTPQADVEKLAKRNMITQSLGIPSLLLASSGQVNRSLLKSMTGPLLGTDDIPVLGTDDIPVLTYRRFEGSRQSLEGQNSAPELLQQRPIENISHWRALETVGRRMAQKEVPASVFSSSFDIRRLPAGVAEARQTGQGEEISE